MSTRTVERKSTSDGKIRKVWVVNICRKDPATGKQIVYRHDALVQTRRGAEDQYRKVLNSIADGTYWDTYGKEMENDGESDTLSEMPTVSKFFEEFLGIARMQNKHSEVLSKQGLYDRYLRESFGDLKLDAITPRKIDAFSAELFSRKLHPKTINNALAVLRRMLNYAVEVDVIEKVPRIRQLKAPESKFDYLTFQELDQLLAAASYNPEWRAMIFFAAKTGMRWGELSELRWSDLDLEEGTARVERSFTKGQVTTRKNHHAYTAFLTPATVEFLEKHKHDKGELVFCKADGGRHIHRRADVALKRCCRKAELRQISWHVLRHTFASHLAMKGVSLLEIKELLGHRDIKSTLRYEHLMPDHKHKAVSVLDEPVFETDDVELKPTSELQAEVNPDSDLDSGAPMTDSDVETHETCSDADSAPDCLLADDDKDDDSDDSLRRIATDSTKSLQI